MTELLELLQNTSGIKWLAIVIGMLLVWFLPALLSLFFNRKHSKLIAIACIPAGLSFLAWGALLAWAVTGKAVEKYLPQKVKKRLMQAK